MKERILTGWTFSRIAFAVIGTFIIVQSALQLQWFGVLFGSYFASMGIFAFGCASGGCFGGNCNNQIIHKDKTEITDVKFEEIK